MILNFLVKIINDVLIANSYLLLNYDLFALPQSGLDVIADAFSLFNFIGTLPVARVIWPWILVFWVVWKFVFVWNIAIKFLTIIPLFSGLKNLAIRSSEEFNSHPVDRREWHIPVRGIGTNNKYKIPKKNIHIN